MNADDKAYIKLVFAKIKSLIADMVVEKLGSQAVVRCIGQTQECDWRHGEEAGSYRRCRAQAVVLLLTAGTATVMSVKFCLVAVSLMNLCLL
jgi:hypothetical protein